MNKCSIYDEDSRVISSHYKSSSKKKSENQFRGKPYVTPADKRKKKFHLKSGHISTQCQKPKNTPTSVAQSNGGVFSLSGTDVLKSDNLIRGTSCIHGVALIAMIDTGTTHSFISLECVNKLKLEVFYRNGSMVIDTSTNGSVTTSLVCLNCPLTIYGKDFAVDLICFPLSQLDVILGMNLLEFNCVYINCFDKTVLFPEPEENTYSIFLHAGQVEMSLREND
ncbi:uncharacterized protein LOC127121912 [Lathyrus oleraceus]|uniref:uncharacterized protein LOC127121912 n=1 Tax=Pisum sativum TaxID=3888 RepID=UPI0021CF1B0A|nr:uncharacterized protein LOC127121912 [Pisum sativum]